MLARALKVLGYLTISTTRTAIATAALFQPGDEAGAYGRTVTPWQRSTAELAARETEVADMAAGAFNQGQERRCRCNSLPSSQISSATARLGYLL
jgi:hypothetical protein